MKSFGPKTLIYPTPVFVIVTYMEDGRPNIMTAAWAGICCSRPPCIAVSLRKATATHGNLLRSKAFTVGVPSEEHARQVDYCGLVSGRETDKFAATRLTPVPSTLVAAPFVAEFPMTLECRLAQIHELGLHTQFIGEILDVKAREEMVAGDGLLDIHKVRPLVFTPDSEEYFGIGERVGQAFSLGERIRSYFEGR